MDPVNYSDMLVQFEMLKKNLLQRVQAAGVDSHTEELLTNLIFLADKWYNTNKRKTQVVPGQNLPSGYRACSMELRSYIEVFLFKLQQK